MILTFGSQYQLHRLRQGGWELYKWQEAKEITKGTHAGKKSEAKWKSMGKFPHNLEHAVRIMGEDYMSNKNGTFDSKAGLTLVAQYLNSLKVVAEKAEGALDDSAA